MLIDKDHYFKRFKKPLENTFQNHQNIISQRQTYINDLNLPFYLIQTNTQLKVEKGLAFILLNNSDLTIEGNFDTLIIEDISSINNKIHIINKNLSKIIFINNPQTSLSIEKDITVDNYSNLNFNLTSVKRESFVKNNLLLNLFDEAQSQTNVFINTDKKQVYDLTSEIIHKSSNSYSNIDFVGLNEGKLVSQINSIIEKKSYDCELHQHIKHILFNEDAMSYSKPSLMIHTPCVASHGNSIGSIPEDWLFYLQTKGLTNEVCLQIIKESLKARFIHTIDLPFIEPLLEQNNEY